MAGVILEPTLARVDHPETLRVDSIDGVTHLLRVDHPVVAPLQEGNPSIGWEGDPRLCMYLDGRANAWVLMRLEADFQYRVVTVSPVDRPLNPEEINKLCLRLVMHDTRRGFNPKEAVDSHNATVDAEKQKVADERHEQVADKLAWGLKKDGADNYL